MSETVTRLLVVDDNPAGRYATAHVLRSVGFEVLEAGSGNEAIKIVAENDPDLVVLDVNLPDIDGFEVCRRIRASESSARTPVIHLSATFVKDVDKVHGLEAGADGYLVHPVEPPVLIATVKAFLRARQAEEDRERLLISERAARAEAEHANRIKDEFLATLSHELRTPLQAIIGWAQLLKIGHLSAEDTASAVDVIERNAQAQAQMIADLLDISRITSGKLRLDVQPVDPASMIEAAVLAILPAADAKGIRITRVLDPHAGPVQGDPARLQQVVWNLVNNAVKFTPKGGKVEVILRRIDSHVQLTVSDNGQGIDGNQLLRIFDRFTQGDSSSTRTHGGLGLGLAIARQLVELHGGRIAAESAGPGLGASFAVTLPISPTAHRMRTSVEGAGPETETPLGKLVDLHGVRVLLVDDDVDARQILLRFLHICGAETQEASNMAQALELITSFQPRVLLSDLGMPEHDGFELIRSVRQSGKSADLLPAIALTGFARSEDRHRALLAGFQMHMSKPIDPQELTAAIAMLVGRVN
jgi:signal transduction histidine kinase